MTRKLNDISCNTEEVVNNNFNVASESSSLNRIHDDSFLTILDLPKCLKILNITSKCGNDVPVSIESLELNVRNIRIPPIQINSQKIQFGSGSFTESSKKLVDFEEVTIQFKLSEKMHNYDILYRWLNMLVNIEDGRSVGFTKSQYETTYTAIILNQYKQPVGSYTYHGVVPVALGSIDLNNTSNGEPLFIDFTFAYDYGTFELDSAENNISDN